MRRSKSEPLAACESPDERQRGILRALERAYHLAEVDEQEEEQEKEPSDEEK